MVALASCLTPARGDDDPGIAWNKEAAGQYLDGREDAWFAWPTANRGQPPTRTSCVCCHTLVPYALARPVLRGLAGGGEVAPAEKRLLDQTRRRVEHWDELETNGWKLLYDFDAEKKSQSRGTEAVLNALMLAFDDRYENRAEMGDATKKAFQILWSTQARSGTDKGSWDWLDFGLEPWESGSARYYGAALAALAVGAAPGGLGSSTDPAIQERVGDLRAYLRSRYDDQSLHDRVYALWASKVLGGVLGDEQIAQLIAKLNQAQKDDGGWCLATLGTYTRSDGTPQAVTSDAYATGLILHVLRVSGQPADDPGVVRGLAWLRSHQRPGGSWPGSSLNKNRSPESFTGRFMDDAATAFAVLALGHTP